MKLLLCAWILQLTFATHLQGQGSGLETEHQEGEISEGTYHHKGRQTNSGSLINGHSTPVDTISIGIFRPAILDYLYGVARDPIPETKVTLVAYDAPQGKRVGTLYMEYSSSTETTSVEFVPFGDEEEGASIEAGWNEFYFNWYGYLTYYTNKEGFLNVLNKTIAGGIWVKGQGYEEVFEPISFLEFTCLHESFQVSGYTGQYLCNRARGYEVNQLVKLDEEIHRFSHFTGRTSGSWAEVVIHEINPSDMIENCYPKEDLIKISHREWRGWIKVVNGNGSLGKIKIIHC